MAFNRPYDVYVHVYCNSPPQAPSPLPSPPLPASPPAPAPTSPVRAAELYWQSRDGTLLTLVALPLLIVFLGGVRAPDGF